MGCDPTFLKGELSSMNPFRLRQSLDMFRTRSARRDKEFDDELITQIAVAIDLAIKKTEEQRAGLKRRIEDVISRAAIVGGNEIDEYLTRDGIRSSMPSGSEKEIQSGHERLNLLERICLTLDFSETGRGLKGF
jgi:hypothetical protein